MAVRLYGETQGCPPEERFGLVGQMKRAAVSIASNIAEGAARQTKPEFRRFLRVAAGSASELDTQTEISQQIGILAAARVEALRDQLSQISRMIQGLIKSLK